MSLRNSETNGFRYWLNTQDNERNYRYVHMFKTVSDKMTKLHILSVQLFSQEKTPIRFIPSCGECLFSRTFDQRNEEKESRKNQKQKFRELKRKMCKH